MPEPTIDIIPARDAVRSDGTTTLDVLVRITPATPEVHFIRPTINLGLVLDRSGSMAEGKKMAYAREAASFAVAQLLPTDRVSVTIFDDLVETIVPSVPAIEKSRLVRLIDGILPRGSTDLHAGWKAGGDQVAANLVSDGLNRVILLSDGLANVGLTDPNVIALEAKGLASRGVSTTTMGLGDDYNEDLMQNVGERGDGNYYYIESPVQLTDIFQTEMKGLMANTGRNVSLGIEPLAGATVSEVLNDLDRNANGRLMLPNLVVGMPILVVVRLKIPLSPRKADLCRFRLAWDDPKGGPRRSRYVTLALGPCPSPAWDALADDPQVTEQVAILMAARAKKEAIAAFDRGDLLATRALIGQARSEVDALGASDLVLEELAEIDKLNADLDQDDHAKIPRSDGQGGEAYRRKRGQGP